MTGPCNVDGSAARLQSVGTPVRFRTRLRNSLNLTELSTQGVIMNEQEAVCIEAPPSDSVVSACEGPVTFGPDPYEQDVNGDDTPVWLCQRHADDRAMEI